MLVTRRVIRVTNNTRNPHEDSNVCGHFAKKELNFVISALFRSKFLVTGLDDYYYLKV